MHDVIDIACRKVRGVDRRLHEAIGYAGLGRLARSIIRIEYRCRRRRGFRARIAYREPIDAEDYKESAEGWKPGSVEHEEILARYEASLNNL